jgi:MoaA/NifB/PqqE/SkfB family radical SAM enzyme
MRITDPEAFNTSLNFTIEPTFKCNVKCVHCCNSLEIGKIKDPTLEEILQQIDRQPPKGVVFASGGEPTLRDNLADIFKYVKQKGKKTHLNTNGIRLATDEKYLEELLPYVDLITLPMHSSDPIIFDAVTQVQGSYDKVLSVFSKLVKNDKVMVVPQMVINQLNYKTLFDTVDMINKVFPETLRTVLTYTIPVGAARTTSVTPRFSDVKKYLLPVLEKYEDRVVIYNVPRCHLYPYCDNLEFEGGENTCTVDGEKKDLANRMKAPVCASCIFNDKCLGIWKEYGELYPDLDLIPVRNK